MQSTCIDYKPRTPMRLAPIGVIAEKLRSRSPEVRAVALLHAQGHGSNARGLAAHVVTLLEDDERVAWHAASTLGVIAPGAADAVPPLVRLLENPKAPAKLVTRALFGLQKVGPEAWAALPALEPLYDGPHRPEVLAAMAAIAPNAPSVSPRIALALFDEDHRTQTAAADALARGGPVDAAVAQLRLHAFSFSKRKREAAHRALTTLAPLKPDAVTQLLRELIRAPTPARAVLVALQHLPSPLHPELAAFAARSLDSSDLEAVTWALKAVEKHGLDVDLRALLRRYSATTSGGLAGRVFATTARLLKGQERETVDAWLERVTKAEAINWYTVAEALKASPTESNIVALTRAAERFARTERSSVLDFHRKVRELTTVDVLDKAGVPVTDPYASEGDEPDIDPADADYPDFPRDEEPPPPGKLEPAEDAPSLDADLGHGLTLLGRSLTASPADLAAGLQTFFERQQGQSLDDAAVQGLAAVWAHCLVTRMTWRWARWVRGDERALVLASPLGTQMVFPAAWVRRQLKKREPTVLAQFNQLVAGHVPPPGDEPTALW